MKMVISKSFTRNFKLSKGYNSLGGDVSYSASVEIEVKDLKDPLVEKTKDLLDAKVNQWVVDELTDQINIVNNEMKAIK